MNVFRGFVIAAPFALALWALIIYGISCIVAGNGVD